MFGIIDCGTTNTRVYLVENEKVISQSFKKVGVRDTAIHGTKNILKEGVIDTIHNALNKTDKTISDIDYLIASGMITSEIGLIEIPHLIAPVGKKELSNSIKVVRDDNILPINVPIYFIRGIKNKIYGQNGINDLKYVDFMRGEEVQVMGILETFKPKLPVNIIIVGSHTKLIHVDKDSKIKGSITTISGQFYEAIIKETFIGKCIRQGENEKENKYPYDQIVSIAENCVENAGILRTMLMPRFMQVLMETTTRERSIFVNATIAAEDMKIFNEAENYEFDLDTEYFVMSQEERCKLYEIFLKNRIHKDLIVTKIFDKDDIRDITIKGILEIIKISKLI